jgi:hypothetical protein
MQSDHNSATLIERRAEFIMYVCKVGYRGYVSPSLTAINVPIVPVRDFSVRIRCFIGFFACRLDTSRSP